MSGINRTEQNLLNLFADSPVAGITAQDGRDLISTAFGFPSMVDPSPNWDRVDTAGVGGFFDRLSKVWNYVTGAYWLCRDGTPTAAQWIKIGPSIPPPDLDDIFPAEIVGTVGICTPLKITGLIGAISAGDFTINFGPSAAQSIGFPMLIESVVGFPAGTYIIDVDQITGIANTSQPASGTISTGFDLSPLTYGWYEKAPDPVTGELGKKPGGRSGTYLTAPAFLLGGGTTGDLKDVWMRPKGIIQGLPTFEFWGPPPGNGGGYSFGSTTQIYNTTYDYLGNSTYPTTINYNANVSLNFWNGAALVPLFVGPTINPGLLPTGPGTHWERFEVDASDFPAGGETIVLRTMGGNEIVQGVARIITQLWTFNFSTTGAIACGYKDGSGPTPVNHTQYGAANVVVGGASVPVSDVIAFTFNSDDSQSVPGGAPWTLTATDTTSGGGATAGHCVFWVEIGQMP